MFVTLAFQQESTEEGGETCADLGPLCDRLLDWTGNEEFAETVTWLLGTPLKILFIIVGALVLNSVVRSLVKRGTMRLGQVTADHGELVVTDRSVERAEERAKTIGQLLRSLSTAVIYGIALVMILETLGLSIIPIIASAGVLALAIGFGAQSIVEDLLRGVFMLTEDQLGVGDRVGQRVRGTSHAPHGGGPGPGWHDLACPQQRDRPGGQRDTVEVTRHHRHRRAIFH